LRHTLLLHLADCHCTPLQVPVAGLASEQLSMWMTTTYLDGGLRVSRDDAGKVYVMLKDSSGTQ
jgi:hypothetical protein